MNFRDWKERRYHIYLEDIEIARKEIADVMLFPEGDIICDLYALPSHNLQTYYAMLYKCGRHLEMVYARTEFYTSPHSEPIRMYSFADNKEAGKQPELDGRIITGIKHIPAELERLAADIIEKLPDEKYIQEENHIIIDGVFQAIRVYEGSNVIKEAAYYDAEMIPLKDHNEFLTEELGSLYIKIGDLIGS